MARQYPCNDKRWMSSCPGRLLPFATGSNGSDHVIRQKTRPSWRYAARPRDRSEEINRSAEVWNRSRRHHPPAFEDARRLTDYRFLTAFFLAQRVHSFWNRLKSLARNRLTTYVGQTVSAFLYFFQGTTNAFEPLDVAND